ASTPPALSCRTHTPWCISGATATAVRRRSIFAPWMPCWKASAPAVRPLLPNILVPQLRTSGNEFSHQADAGFVLQHAEFHAVGTKQVFAAHESLVFADHDFGNAVKQDRPGAHGAGRKRGVDHRLPVNLGGLASGVLECIHLPVQNGAAALYPAVMAPADDAAVVHQHRADGNAAFLQAQAGLVDGGLHEFVHTVSSFYF